MNIISSVKSYLWPTTPYFTDIALPEGALTKVNPEIITTPCYLNMSTTWASRTWNVTVINHTNFKFKSLGCGTLQLNETYVGIGNVSIYNYIKSHLELEADHQIVAYCMENHPNLFFFEIQCLNSLKTQKFYIDINVTKKCHLNFTTDLFIPFNTEISEEKIEKIAAKFTQRRTNLELVLKGYSEKESLLSELQIPRDIISHIAKLYCDVLKNEMQST